MDNIQQDSKINIKTLSPLNELLEVATEQDAALRPTMEKVLLQMHEFIKVNRNEQEVEKYLGNQMPIEKAIGRMNICKLMHWFIRYAFSVMKFNIITVVVIDSF